MFEKHMHYYFFYSLGEPCSANKEIGKFLEVNDRKAKTDVSLPQTFKH